MTLISLIGWLGAICFAVCAVPQAYQCYREGHAIGINWVFLLLWIGGEVLSLVYVLLTMAAAWPLIFNYVMSIIFTLVILKYKVFPRKSTANAP